MVSNAERWKDYIEKGWHYADPSMYNVYISYEKNIENGVDLPGEGVHVICFDPENPKYYLGRFVRNMSVPENESEPFKAYESFSGDKYLTNVLWCYMPDFCYEL